MIQKPFYHLLPLCVFIVFLFPDRTPAQWHLDLESGIVFSGYNDVQIPGDVGTKFSLTEDFTTDPAFFFRLKILYNLNPRHQLALLYAPLQVEATSRADRAIYFVDKTFPASRDLVATYRFDSYRLSYRYRIYKTDSFNFWIGITAKIRDAAIRLEDDSQSAEKTNTGFVPILNFRVDWKWNKQFSLVLDGDALAAPQGRAEDILLAIQYGISETVSCKAGYRILEGGSDNDEVYSFALFHYLLAGIIITF